MSLSTRSNLKTEDILKWHKGRGSSKNSHKEQRSGSGYNRSSAGFKLFPTASYGSNRASSELSPSDKASGIVNNLPESMVKIDKASKGIKCQKHMMAAADYISRHGMIDLEDENGEFLTHDELESRIEDWCKSQNTPYEEDGKKRAAEARRLVISCPKGTDPEAVKKAVRELAKECFANEDYRYLFAIHNRSKEMPNEPDHPHVHLLIKAINSRGKRLNLRKEDLRYLRERFAVIAKKYGIDMNATTRAQRGHTQKSKTQERIHQEDREWSKHLSPSHPYDLSRMNQIDDALNTGKDIPESVAKQKAVKTRENIIKNANEYIKELIASGNTENLKLAADLERYISNMSPVKTSQEELLRKIREFNQIQKEKGYDIKEKIRQRKSHQSKQSRAQKWAIHRKKQNQER